MLLGFGVADSGVAEGEAADFACDAARIISILLSFFSGGGLEAASLRAAADAWPVSAAFDAARIISILLSFFSAGGSGEGGAGLACFGGL